MTGIDFPPGPCLVDTNILIYAAGIQEPRKTAQAIRVLARLRGERRMCLSSQVLAEFFAKLTSRMGISPREAAKSLEILTEDALIFSYGREHVLAAARQAEERKMHFWDALIWAVARANSIRCVVSEDGPSGHKIEGVLYFNPFQE